MLESYAPQGIAYHALRSRQAAARKFLVVHLLVPGEWSVLQAHQLAEQVETQVSSVIPGANIVTHVEPEGDPLSMRDASIDPPDANKNASGEAS